MQIEKDNNLIGLIEEKIDSGMIIEKINGGLVEEKISRGMMEENDFSWDKDVIDKKNVSINKKTKARIVEQLSTIWVNGVLSKRSSAIKVAKEGFKGFNNMSDEEIVKLYKVMFKKDPD